ncbi:MAG: RHS repeat-associated core domain-containing protein, partial [Verrucomicrobiota bacterium]
TRTEEFGSTEDRQKANSKDEDPTGLLNEGFRYRDLEAGVFITRDPLAFVDGPNVYAYVNQNPWTFFDPQGLQKAVRRNREVTPLTAADVGNFALNVGKGAVESVVGIGQGIAQTGTAIGSLGTEQGRANFIKGASFVANNPGAVGDAIDQAVTDFGQSIQTSEGAAKALGGAAVGGALAKAGQALKANQLSKSLTSGMGDDLAGSARGTSFRGDKASLDVDTAFNKGIQPKGSNMDLEASAKSTSQSNSGFVPTSKSEAIANEFGGKNGNVFTIQSDRGIDVNKTLGNKSPFPEQQEVAFPGGIKPNEIVGARSKKTGEFRKNPNFKKPDEKK